MSFLKQKFGIGLNRHWEHLLRYFHLDYDDARALGGIIESQVPNEERQEGIRAFFEKRKPDWSNIFKKT